MTVVERQAVRLKEVRGWRRLAAAFALGLLVVVALPPLYGLPALAVSLPGLLWLLDGASRKRTAFVIGWVFGLGFFAGGLYWIANALLIDAARFGWMVPFAIGGLAALFAVYTGLTALVVHLSGARGWLRIVVLVAAWTLAEWLRGWVLTGFPWNPLATVWMPFESVLQTVAWVGAYGLSGLTVALAALPAVLGWPGRRWLPLAVGVAGLAAVAGAGSLRLPDGPAETVPDVRLRLVQPSIPQADKWKADQRLGNLRQHIALSLQPGPEPVTHVIWGETALPFPLDGLNDGELLAAIATALDNTDGSVVEPLLITGTVRRTPPGVAPYQVWNSLVAVDRQGRDRGRFDKAHLVPFGEYVPFRDVLPLDKITPGATDFSAGPGPRTVGLPGLPPASPLICYEVIFPGAVADAANRPAWLLNLTNDGWYGLSTGPYQHLATARLRAVEEGLPLVRVANTGISAIIDPWGRVVVRIGLQEAGVVDGPLPVAAAPTVFARWGNGPVVISTLVLIFAGIALGWRRKFEGDLHKSA